MVEKNQNNSILWHMKIYKIKIVLFVNKVLLGHGHAYLHIWLLSSYSGRIE